MKATQSLKVISLINGLIPDGAERSLAVLLPKLRERGIEVEIVCLHRQEGSLERDLRRQHFRISILRSRTGVGRVLELRRLFKANCPDLIHTTIIEADIVGRISAWGIGVPVVSSLVNTSYDPTRLRDSNVASWKLRIVRLVDSLTARHLTIGFHALTEAVADQATRSLGVPRSRIIVIGRGRDVKQLGDISETRRANSREILGFDKRHVIVSAVGRQEFQKGHVTLVEAAARLSTSRPELRLLIVGRAGSETERIQRRIEKLGLENVVLNLGYRDDVPEVLAASDLFAFPSLFEGFGGSLLEAMAMGVPAVVSDLPALREVGGDCVRYVAPGAVESWTSTLLALLADRGSREDLATCARARVRARFDIERIADAHADWYRQMANSENGRFTG